MFKEYQPIDWVCVEIANNFGNDGDFKGDKDTFENRIQWVKDNFNVLFDRVDEADEPELYFKSCVALEDICNGKKTGAMVSLDATCSGIQLLSAITGCYKGSLHTNLVDPHNRYDIYSDTTEVINSLLPSTAQIVVPRGDAKDAMMTLTI